LLASFHTILGIGLLRLNYWARLVTLLFTVINLFLSVTGILIESTSPIYPSTLLDRKISLPMVVVLAVVIWIQWYLRRPNVKKAFGMETI
jgi:hypothetical protein